MSLKVLHKGFGFGPDKIQRHSIRLIRAESERIVVNPEQKHQKNLISEIVSPEQTTVFRQPSWVEPTPKPHSAPWFEIKEVRRMLPVSRGAAMGAWIVDLFVSLSAVTVMVVGLHSLQFYASSIQIFLERFFPFFSDITWAVQVSQFILLGLAAVFVLQFLVTLVLGQTLGKHLFGFASHEASGFGSRVVKAFYSGLTESLSLGGSLTLIWLLMTPSKPFLFLNGSDYYLRN